MSRGSQPHARSAPLLGMSRFSDERCASRLRATSRSDGRGPRLAPRPRPRPGNVVDLGYSRHDLPPLPLLRATVSDRKRAAVARINASSLFRPSWLARPATAAAAPAPAAGPHLSGVALLQSKAQPQRPPRQWRARRLRNCTTRGRAVDVFGQVRGACLPTAHPYPGPAVAAPPPAVF